VLAAEGRPPYARLPMDTSDPNPPWLRNAELITGIVSVLCILAILMIIVLHLWWRTGCTSIGIC
jgi:hypothetical protein